MQPKHTQELIEYLDANLHKEDKFTKVGPASFLYTNKGGVIYVKVNAENILIVNDGPDGVGGLDLIRAIEPADAAHADELHKQVIEDILSLIE